MEVAIRLGFFLGIFIVMIIWEILYPKRKLIAGRTSRWPANITISILNTIIVRLIPILPITVALALPDWGILNVMGIPMWMKVVIGFLALDYIIYIQHVTFHRIKFFWRFHKMHHTDLDIDVTTGARFHPIEILFSLLIKIFAVFVIGVPAAAVLIFEVVLNATAMFNHSNVQVNRVVDRLLRWIIVTPDMHRVHHSIYREETDSNFGFNLPWWDYLFSTYKAKPRDGHKNMKIGLSIFQNKGYLSLKWLLLIPFVEERK